MKLKTLKDIEDAKYCECGSNQGTPCVVCGTSYEAKGCVARDELRQEAIKWIKDAEEQEWCNYIEGRIDFIKEFFNLTEENLK